jgi:hypothetical protein
MSTSDENQILILTITHPPSNNTSEQKIVFLLLYHIMYDTKKIDHNKIFYRYRYIEV